MGAAVFVLTAYPPVSASERELMARVAELSVTMFVVLNKADYLTGCELAEALEFTARVAAEATSSGSGFLGLSAQFGTKFCGAGVSLESGAVAGTFASVVFGPWVL